MRSNTIITFIMFEQIQQEFVSFGFQAGEAAQQSKSEGSAAGSEESKNKPPAEAKDSGGGGSSGSSEEESSDEDTKKDPADSEVPHPRLYGIEVQFVFIPPIKSGLMVTSVFLQELDMSSTFVSNAAQIARRQLEQNPRAERKRRPPPTTTTEEAKSPPEKPEGAPEEDKKQVKRGPSFITIFLYYNALLE